MDNSYDPLVWLGRKIRRRSAAEPAPYPDEPARATFHAASPPEA